MSHHIVWDKGFLTRYNFSLHNIDRTLNTFYIFKIMKYHIYVLLNLYGVPCVNKVLFRFISAELKSLMSPKIQATVGDKEKATEDRPKVYKVRWLILSIFVLYSTTNAMQWIQYSIIADVIMVYYGISATAVNWTSMIYMATYIPFVFPASFILDKLVSCLDLFKGI